MAKFTLVGERINTMNNISVCNEEEAKQIKKELEIAGYKRTSKRISYYCYNETWKNDNDTVKVTRIFIRKDKQ